MSGAEEAAAIAAILEADSVYAGSTVAAGELGTMGAGAAAASGAGLTAADYAAMGLSNGAGGAAYGGSGLTAADYAAMNASVPYGAGDTVTGSLIGSEYVPAGQLSTPYGAADTVNGSLTNTEAGNALGNMKNTAVNAFNKVGGKINKLPGPVQGLVMKGLLGQPPQASGPATAMPHAAPSSVAPIQPAYNQAPPKTFGSQYGSNAGLLGDPSTRQLTPQEIEMLKRRRMYA